MAATRKDERGLKSEKDLGEHALRDEQMSLREENEASLMEGDRWEGGAGLFSANVL